MKRLVMIGSIACLWSFQAIADCVEPQSVPVLPDGATATRDDMVAAQKAFRVYDRDIAEYTACLEKLGGSASRQNAAVGKLEKIADKLNNELRAFKKKGGA